MDQYGSISNANTDIPSNQYPHTKAVQIQQAKYKFVVSGGVNVQHGKQGTWQKPGQAAAPAPTPAPEQAAPEAPATQETPEPQPQAPVEQPEAATPQPAQQQPAQQQPAQPQQPAQQQPAQPQQPAQQQPAQQQEAAPKQATAGISDAAAKVIELTNAERRKNGLPDYQADAQLSGVAKVKSDDMQQNNYFSHTSPTHGSPFDMIRDHGVSYRSAGENIAQGQRTPEQVVQAWMNSEGHRKNIMSADFTHIGVGYNENGHYWTQMFIKK
ncbi:hypothetical protein DS745_12040 [Anaerobacillus alkaliphilus]|uniref:SCP domain-containing protein n=2 Tax=Anaerobacillus alkaliphilus TaxID=1548597 RepID=A0A4Q0VSX2_9BACI|nr:hypothetical protein DS745_12040 [Anaerobacillus alkaliphilus]